MTRREVLSTYRLQLTRDFPLAAARALVPYFHELGVSHLYLSPVLAARPGSTHGYDVVDPTRVNPELGVEDDLRALAAELHELGMGIILDIVPNHMAASAENPWWDNLLERGQGSAYAGWFDVDWDAPGADGKIVLPVLGDELHAVVQRGELKPAVSATAVRLAYFDRSVPIDPATLPRELQLAVFDPAAKPAVDEWAAGADGVKRLMALLDAQHYRLTFWRRAPEQLNYRRFFDVNDLVALRMDAEDVFMATHKLVLEWVSAGVLDGLRVDHVDGLLAPSWYVARLRQEVDARRAADAPDPFPIYVEKILAADEALPGEWPVQGTTGYDFMNQVGDLTVDPDGFREIEANYRGLRKNPLLAFGEVARGGKRRALNGALRPDVRRVARAALAWRPELPISDVARAIVEVIVHLDAYRTYVVEPGQVSAQDRRLLEAALAAARATPDVSADAIAMIERAFFAPPDAADTARAAFVARFQQTSGPAAAKGVEDTALYAYVPLVSRNEVGGAPDRPLADAAKRMHDANDARARDWPGAMLATNSHDTKRSADVRARLDALSALPDEWARYVARWRRLNRAHKQTVHGKPAPTTNAEYLFYQTLVGIWPPPAEGRRVDDLPDAEWRQRTRERLRPYALKAAREAKLSTSWTDSDPEYEKALDEFVRASLHVSPDEVFLPDVARLIALIADGAAHLALARVTLHLLSPGVPDLYQGDELWNFTLVDPDNRRPVDFARRRKLLEEPDTADVLRAAFRGESPLTDDRVKLALTARLLRFRREHAELVRGGGYTSLLADTSGVFAFVRRARAEVCIVLVRTRVPGSDDAPAASSFAVLPHELAGPWRSVLTARALAIAPGATTIGDLLPDGQPAEVFVASHG